MRPDPAARRYQHHAFEWPDPQVGDGMTNTTVPDCTCTPPWPGLVTVIDDERRPAQPTDEHSAAESESEAHCTGCGLAYPGHWTLKKTTLTVATDPKGAPATATDLLRAIVARRPNGEVRPQQERMVDLVETAIKNKHHLLVQAGTGTGKSLGYLIPAIASGKRVIISTATKQLGEQIINEDMPTLATAIPEVGGRDFDYALIKGRSNYACLREMDSLLRLDNEAPGGDQQEGLFADPTPRENSRRPSTEDLSKLNDLLKWADTTETGDRTEAPPVPDRVWDKISTDAAGCAGKSCPFYDPCFAEAARANAREADVVVTNHAQVAQDLSSEFPLLGEWDVLVTDEVHELESYLSSAWGLEVAPNSMKHHFSQAVRKLPRSDAYEQAREIGHQVLDQFEELTLLLNDERAGLMPDLSKPVSALLTAIAKNLRSLMDSFSLASGEKSVSSAVAADRKGAGQKMQQMCEAVASMCLDMSDGKNVRWLEEGFGNRGPCLKVAPLWIGPRLMSLLGDRTLVATSATVTVGGSFDSFIRTLALQEPVAVEGKNEPQDPRPFDAVDVGTPFDYDKQAILYIPSPQFPAPVGQEREAHTRAVQEEVAALVKAAGGRTLALFTTRRGAEAAAAHLRATVTTPVLCQGDAPPSQLIEEFKDDQRTTLCATMGFWHGVNAPGATLSCVILDKAPFAPMNDPLMSARRDAVDKEGRRGFDEVYVAGASVMLSQGVGRLIRTATDKGVVAVLDNRLLSKNYGRTMIGSMPNMRIYRDRAVVEGALSRLAAVADQEAQLPAIPAKASVSGSPRNGRSGSQARAGTGKVRKAAPRKRATRKI